MDNKPWISGIYKLIFFGVIIILFAVILWSAVTETLIPLYREQKFDEFVYNIFGIPFLIFGVCIFTYGGWVFVMDTYRLLYLNAELAKNIYIIRDKSQPKEAKREARTINIKILFSACKKGGFRLIIGAITIFAGIILINFKKIL